MSKWLNGLKRCVKAPQKAIVLEYGLCKDYVAKLKRSNPGSIVDLVTYDSEDRKTEIYRCLYICFDAHIREFKAGCKRIIVIDGAFLKLTIRGQMPTTIGRDSNDQIYLIA